MTRRYIGLAGWTEAVSKYKSTFDAADSALATYATRFNCVEINGSFYRSFSRAMYEKWRDETPADFRFSVKLPRTITQYKRLKECEDALSQFLEETGGLGIKRAVLLMQLPPSLMFDADSVTRFMDDFRQKYDGFIVCEPRHASWTETAAVQLLQHYRVYPVLTQPLTELTLLQPQDNPLVYVRLHGEPRRFYSSYSDEYLTTLHTELGRFNDAEQWVIFNNTASNAGLMNGVALKDIEAK